MNAHLGNLSVELISKIGSRTGHTKVGYRDCHVRRRGAFTVAMIELYRDKDSENEIIVSGIGFSKCHPNDKFRFDIGHRIALSRAIRDALEVLGE